MRRLLFVWLIALCGPVRAQTRAAAVPELYPAASPGWTAAIAGALSSAPPGASLSPSLAALTAPNLTPSATFAPVAAHLETSLGLAPAAFAALPATERRAALDLAVDAAREELQQKAYALDAQSQALAAPNHALDKDGRAELYGVVANLREMRASYGPLLDDESRARVEESYSRALVRAVQARNALIGGRADALGASLSAANRDDDSSLAAADPVLMPGVAPHAVKLYEQMSRSTAGWGADDVDALLTGYGFVRRDGKHRNYSHPDFPQLHDSYSHQRQLKDVYIKSALHMVRELTLLRARAAASGAAASSAAVPADLSRVTLQDLSVLLSPAKPTAPKPVQEEELAAAPAAAPAKSATIMLASRETTVRRPDRLAPATARPAAPEAAPPAPASPSAALAPTTPSALSRASAWVKSALGL